MASSLTDVVVGPNWKWVQISGTGDADPTVNCISFLRPVTVRRVVANTSVPNEPFATYHSLDGTDNPEQIVILSQNCPDVPAQSLIHDSDFSVHLPQYTPVKAHVPGGKICIETTGLGGGDTWTLTVEAKE